MAYIKNTMFAIRANNNVNDELANITGKFQNGSSADEICSAGFLCVRDSRLANSAYTGVDNENAYVMKAATDAAKVNTGIFACNTFGVNEVTDPVTGNVYKNGKNTLGLPLPAGVPGTFTEIDFAANKKTYRFGYGNINGTIGTNTYFTIDDGMLIPAASAPATNGAVYFELVATGPMIAGTYPVGEDVSGTFTVRNWYDLMARSVVA